MLSYKISHANNTPWISKIKQAYKSTFLNNTETAISDSHQVIVEEAGLLGCCAVWLGDFFPKFRKKTHNLHHQGYE
jgi:hypothetical protein